MIFGRSGFSIIVGALTSCGVVPCSFGADAPAQTFDASIQGFRIGMSMKEVLDLAKKKGLTPQLQHMSLYSQKYGITHSIEDPLAQVMIRPVLGTVLYVLFSHATKHVDDFSLQPVNPPDMLKAGDSKWGARTSEETDLEGNKLVTWGDPKQVSARLTGIALNVTDNNAKQADARVVDDLIEKTLSPPPKF